MPFLSSELKTAGPGTAWIGLGIDPVERFWALAASTVKRIFVSRDVAPGAGCSIAYVVRKNGIDTAVTVTLGAADTSGASSPSATVAYLDGEKFSLKQVRTGSVAPGIDNVTIEFA